MDFLAPMTGLIAAAVAVPLLVLMYFLKLRRREVSVSSTLLWKWAVQDLQVNAPFRRIRRNLLLLLQLLALAAALAALARPVMSMRSGPGKRYVILIDRSASMNVNEAGSQTASHARTRLEEAKRLARDFVETLRGRVTFSLEDRSDKAMVVAFDERAKVLCNFTSDKNRLRAAIDAVEPTDGGTDLTQAVTVARAFAQSPGEDANNRSAEAPAGIELFSDGCLGEEEIVTAPGELTFHRVGAAGENLAITTMQARRSYETPEIVHVFATVSNCGAEGQATDVQLSVDGDVRAVKSVTVGPRKPGRDGQPDSPGETSVSFALSYPSGGVVEVRQLRSDALACDDAAWSVVPPPRKLSVLLVTSGNLALTAALKACPLQKFDQVGPAVFNEMVQSSLGAQQAYDVIVLDNYTPALRGGADGDKLRLPRGRYLVFGPPPPESGVKAVRRQRTAVVVDWLSRHPALQHVNLENLFVSSSYEMQLPRGARVLAEFGDYPAMALVHTGGSAFLLVGFDALDSNWPFQRGFVMFCYNAVGFLGEQLQRRDRSSLAVGQPVVCEVPAAAEEAVLTTPDGGEVDIRPDPSGAYRFADTTRVGVYSLSLPEGRAQRYAVNLLNPRESDIRPNERIVLGGREVEAAATGEGETNTELWPLLAMAVLALALIEWVVYNSKVRL